MKSSFILSSLFLPAFAVFAAPATAATVAPFTITLESVPEGNSTLRIGDQFQGQLSYSAVIPPSGETRLDPSGDPTITLTFTFDGQTYTASDDEAYPDFPMLFFQNGVLRGISFETGNKSPSSLPEGFIIIGSSNNFSYSFDGKGESAGSVSWSSPSPVPEPAALPLVLGAAFLHLRRRRPR